MSTNCDGVSINKTLPNCQQNQNTKQVIDNRLPNALSMGNVGTPVAETETSSASLSTNYDKLLDGGLDCFSANASGIFDTIFMEYRSIRELDSPETGFAIWHINGVCDSEKTIRSGIGNYANYLTKINEFIPKAPEYKVSNIAQNSWLKPFLINKLCIVGLGLREEEFVLRWLLYKRRVCWKQLHNSNSKKNTGWYLYSQKDSLSESSKIFLKSMGIIPICFRDRKTIYKSLFDV